MGRGDRKRARKIAPCPHLSCYERSDMEDCDIEEPSNRGAHFHYGKCPYCHRVICECDDLYDEAVARQMDDRRKRDEDDDRGGVHE